jgi:hypothetical protein
LTGALEHCKNHSKLALFEHFSSNRVGDPFGPQSHGALCLKSKTCWSFIFNLPFFMELEAETPSDHRVLELSI